MTIREMAEQREVAYFSPYASLSRQVPGDATGKSRHAISVRSIKETGIVFYILKHFAD